MTWINVLTSVPLALLFGLIIAWIYKRVMTNFNYSIPIFYTIVYVAMSVSLIMIIVSNDLVRAFTLLGAFAVIRFRTPVKDARDGAFIFFALAAGMGAGVGLYLETALGVILIALFTWLLHASKFGMVGSRQTLIRFTVPQGNGTQAPFQAVLERFVSKATLTNARSLGDGRRLELTYFVTPRSGADLVALSGALSAAPHIADVALIVCEDDEVPDNVF